MCCTPHDAHSHAHTQYVRTRTRWSSFPWEMATAVSEKVFEEGVHEFLLEVHGTGLLGFCQASFTEQRANIGKHWLNEHNHNRTWVLHSNGYFANGNKLSANERLARFTSGGTKEVCESDE